MLISLLLVPFPFKILYQIQVKREMILRLLLHLQDGSKAWEREWGWGKGKGAKERAFLGREVWINSVSLTGQAYAGSLTNV